MFISLPYLNEDLTFIKQALNQMTKNIFISKAEFCEVCKYVCSQLVPSGSKELDKEALNYAIYWQLCAILDERISFKKNSYSKTNRYRHSLRELLKNRTTDFFDVLEIVDENIDEVMSFSYGKQTLYDYGELNLIKVFLDGKISA